MGLKAYEEPVSLPGCDFTITTTGDWAQVNNGAYTIICVSPGDYTSVGVINLTASGTVGSRRYLRLLPAVEYGQHPYHLAVGDRARIKSFTITGNYWVIDRLTTEGTQANILDSGASNNIINRLHIKGDNTYTLFRFTNSSNNTLQNSVLENGKITSGTDTYAIYLNIGGNEKIIWNEMRDTVSGYQQSAPSLQDNLLYGNEIYITKNLYTNCSGSFDPAGACMCSEGHATAVKGGNVAGKYMTIDSNLFYGYKTSDSTCSGTGGNSTHVVGSDGGHTITNLIFKNNITFSGQANNIYTWSGPLSFLEFRNNVIGYAVTGLSVSYADDVTVDSNIYIRNTTNFVTSAEATNLTNTNNVDKTSDSEYSLCFDYRRITNPKRVCIVQ